MDNVIPSPFSNSCVIKLDQTQYAVYQKSRLEIHSPHGKLLTTISKPLPNKTEEEAVYQLWCQVCLLELLFDELRDRVKLPPNAIESIVEMMRRIDVHLKKQISM
jgi:hypothetical protein